MRSSKETQNSQEYKWFEYNQNNSGGSFDVDDNVCEYVFIEARSVNEANTFANELGIYFNGCSTGRDCSCCGDRWHEPYESIVFPYRYGTLSLSEAKDSGFEYDKTTLIYAENDESEKDSYDLILKDIFEYVKAVCFEHSFHRDKAYVYDRNKKKTVIKRTIKNEK